MLKGTPGQMPQSRKEGDTPNHCHAGARHTPTGHTPGTGHRAVPPLDKAGLGGENSFPRKSRTGTWGLRKETESREEVAGWSVLRWRGACWEFTQKLVRPTLRSKTSEGVTTAEQTLGWVRSRGCVLQVCEKRTVRIPLIIHC